MGAKIIDRQFSERNITDLIFVLSAVHLRAKRGGSFLQVNSTVPNQVIYFQDREITVSSIAHQPLQNTSKVQPTHHGKAQPQLLSLLQRCGAVYKLLALLYASHPAL